jgi:glucose uptake protein GlcU
MMCCPLLPAAGGLIYGCFMPAFQVAANDPFGLLQRQTPPLSVYTTYFYFAVAFTAVSVAANAVLVYRPPFGIQPSSLAAYLTDHKGRALSVLSGLLAAAGDLCQFMGGQTVGYAAAMMVMAYPVVGVLWGLLRLRELRQVPGGKAGAVPWGLLLVVGQVALYVLSVGLLSGSAELRGHA